jgi:RHS repeat-associated protein
VDARSVETDRTFDKLERQTAETYPSYTSENLAFTYDQTSGGNVGIGHLTSFSDESGSTTQKFDNFGNMISTVRTIGANNYTTSYSYDLANRVTQIVYPSGRIVNYTYNSSGYLTQVDTKPSSGGTDTVLASSITHKPFGPITGFTYGNSEALTKTYDNNYWLSTLNTVYSGTYVQELSFGEDNAGNLTSITDSLAAGRDETYTVDGLNRLHTASGAYGSRTYTYDNNSNRATRVAGATTYTSTMTTSTNLLASYTDGTSTRHFTYSASGNMLTDDRTFIGGGALANTFGGRDRLESMTVGTPTVTFKINALGQRVQKATTGTTTDYHFDIFGHIIGESNDSTGADLVEYVFMEGQLLAQIDSSGNIFYVHNNQVNAPQKITNSSRTLVWDYEIEPFGETYATPTATTPTNHRFPGQYADSEDTLSYNNMRDYDPSMGRYIQADPMGLKAGSNLYSYVRGNPTQLADPTGMSASTLVAAVDDASNALDSGGGNLVASAWQKVNEAAFASPTSAAPSPCPCDTSPANLVVAGQIAMDDHWAYVFYQLTSEYGDQRTGTGYKITEHVAPDNGPGSNSNGLWGPVPEDGLISDIFGWQPQVKQPAPDTNSVLTQTLQVVCVDDEGNPHNVLTKTQYHLDQTNDNNVATHEVTYSQPQ